MKKSILVATALLAACSKQQPQQSDQSPKLPSIQYEAPEAADASAPGVKLDCRGAAACV
jgi:uncharacterized lipoprotein YajG